MMERRLRSHRSPTTVSFIKLFWALLGGLLPLLLGLHFLMGVPPASAQLPQQQLIDQLIFPSPQPAGTGAPSSGSSPVPDTPPTSEQIEPTLSPSPSSLPRNLDQSTGSPISIGGIPILYLQSDQYRSEVRAEAVESVINSFLEFSMSGSLPMPEVRAERDSNQQNVLLLGEASNFERTRQYLFTVTYADASAAKGVENPTLNDVRHVAVQWADQLERALLDYRQVKLDQVRGQDPLVLGVSLVQALLYLIVGFFLWRVSCSLLSWLQRRMEDQIGAGWMTWIDIGVTVSRLALALGITLGSIHLAISSIPLLRPFQRRLYFDLTHILRTAFGVLSQPLPNSTLSIASLMVFAGLTILVFTVSHYISQALKQRFLTRIGLDLGTQEASATIFKYSLTLLGMLLVLPFSGLNLSSLAVVAGSLVLGVGLGLQNIFNDYVSYLAILVERPIQVGDLIEVDDLIGTVERIHPWATVVRTLDRVFVIVPNSRLTDRKVVNWSYRDPRCRIHIPVGVAYGSDTTAVKEALYHAARSNSMVLSTPEPQVWLRSFGTSSLDFELLVWINRPQDQFLLTSELNYAIDAEFRRRNIVIPFPQQDLHIRSAEGLQTILGRPRPYTGTSRPNTNVQGRIIIPHGESGHLHLEEYIDPSHLSNGRDEGP